MSDILQALTQVMGQRQTGLYSSIVTRDFYDAFHRHDCRFLAVIEISGYTGINDKLIEMRHIW